MNGLHDLMAKLAAIEEGAKNSDIPAAHRKAKNPDGWWKTSLKDLEAEEKEGKISHPDNLAKNSGRADESYAEEGTETVSDVAPQNSEVQGGAGAADESMAAECGDMPAHGGEGKVELSMSDLLKLMGQLQKGQGPNVGHGDQPLMGDEVGEEFGNAMQGAEGPQVAPVAAVTPTGDDMHSKGAEAEKVNGGGNPLQAHLSELYAEIKARQLDELSKGTLSSYAKKAANSMDTHAYHAYRHQDDKDYDKKEKRKAGIGKAVDKLSLKEANQMARSLRK